MVDWPVLRRQKLIYLYVAIGLFLYFVITFLGITHVVEQERWRPSERTQHDQNGIAIKPK